MTNLMIIALGVLSYLLALLSTYVPGVVWWWIGAFLIISGFLFTLKKRESKMAGLASVIFTNGVFLTLGQYIGLYFPKLIILIVVAGYVMTLVTGIALTYLRETNDTPDRVITHGVKKDAGSSFTETLVKLADNSVTLRGNIEKYGLKMGLKITVVEMDQQEEKNALDFILGKEAHLERRENRRTLD